jgi:hypothetical protein
MKKIFDPYIVLDPTKNDLSSEGHLTQNLFWLFSVLLYKNEYIPGQPLVLEKIISSLHG